MAENALWRCPRCGREFRTRNQWHSCVTHTVESHFEGKPPELREAFDSLLAELRRLGPIRTDAVKSSINIAGRAHFAAVRPLRDCLNVGFVLGRRLDDPRLTRAEQLGPSLYGYRVKVRRADDLDEQLLGWLAEAYALKGRAQSL